MDVCKCIECGCKAAELASKNPTFVQVLCGLVSAVLLIVFLSWAREKAFNRFGR